MVAGMTVAARLLGLSTGALWLGVVLGNGLPAGERALAALAAALLLVLLVSRKRVWPIPLVFLLAGMSLGGGAPRTESSPGRGRGAAKFEGRLTAVERRGRDWLLVATGGARLSVPRLGDRRLDRLAPGVVPGARVAAAVRPDPGTLPRAIAAARVAVVEPPRGPWRLLAPRAALRARFERRVFRRFPHPDRPADGLARAILAGRRQDLDIESWRRLRESGLAHLAVVSGLHVGAVSFGFALLGSPLVGRRHPARRGIALLAAGILLVVLPASSPVLRASSMVLFVRGVAIAGRATSPFSALACSALVLLVASPGLATDVSFVLTVAATLAIVLAAEVRTRFRGARVLVAPWLATWPILVHLTGRCAPWSVPAQLVAGPALAPALAGGWLSVLAGASGFDPGRKVCELACTWILAVATTASRLPGAGALAGPTGWWWLLGSEGTLLVWLGSSKAKVRRAALVCCLGLALWPLRPAPEPAVRGPALTVFDVGHGQAVLARSRHGAVLLDTGAVARSLLRGLRAARVRRVDLLVLSHRDHDHLGAARDLLSAVPPGALVVPPALLAERDLAGLFAEAAARGIPVRPASRGGLLQAGEIEMRVLHPAEGSRDPGNDGSIVALLRIGRLVALIPGDAGARIERRLLASGRSAPADVLVAAHHGAAAATGRALLDAVGPRIVAISAGPRRQFGHPSPETLERIARQGARAFVTSRLGSFRIEPAPGGRLRVVLPGY